MRFKDINFIYKKTAKGLASRESVSNLRSENYAGTLKLKKSFEEYKISLNYHVSDATYALVVKAHESHYMTVHVTTSNFGRPILRGVTNPKLWDLISHGLYLVPNVWIWYGFCEIRPHQQLSTLLEVQDTQTRSVIFPLLLPVSGR